MPKVQHVTTNFSAGEFSPRLRGRTDIEKFNASAEKLENIVVLRQGGATMRPSLDFKGNVRGGSGGWRLIPFVYSRADAFVVELSGNFIRFWQDGEPIETSPFVPYEIASPYSAAMIDNIDYTQGGDTLLLFHPDVPVQRLRRFSATNWVLDAAPFDPGPLYEFGHASQSVTLTLSSAAVGAGRTATASAATFQNADVGRTITAAGGVLLITGFTSTTVVTGTISTAFQGTSLAPATWRLQGTPQTTCTPSAAGPVGTAVTLTAGAAAWRNPDGALGYVELNGGLVRLTGLTSALVADGIVVREMTGTTAAPSDAWVLRAPAWNEYDGFPRTGTFLQQRLWAGGSAGFPFSFFGSKTGLSFDFTPGTADDSAVYKTVDSDDNNIITSIFSGWGTLILLTYGGEFDCRGGIEKPITQLNAQITRRSKWGAAQVRPVGLGNESLFIERGGTSVRVIRQELEKGFTAEDISIFSDHLLLDSGVQSMSYEQKPESVVWITTGDGRLMAMTYNREQGQVSICSGNVENASYRWAVTVPEGSIDATYVLVERDIGGALTTLERLNWAVNPGMDGRVRVETFGGALVFGGFAHLEGETVAALADDVYIGNYVVTSGAVTVPRTTTVLEAGLPYTATIRLSAPEIPTREGSAQGQATSTNRVSVRFLETIGCTSNLEDMGFVQFDALTLDSPPDLFTGVKSVSDSGWLDGESIVELVQALPYPFTVLTVVRSITVNAG